MVAGVQKILDNEAISLLEKIVELSKQDNEYTKAYTDSLKEIGKKQDEVQDIIARGEKTLQEESEKLSQMQKAVEALSSFASSLDDLKSKGFELLGSEIGDELDFSKIVNVTSSTVDSKMNLKVESQFELNKRKEEVEAMVSEIARINKCLDELRNRAKEVQSLYDSAVNHQVDGRKAVIEFLETLVDNEDKRIFDENETIALAALLTTPEIILDDYAKDPAKTRRQYLAKVEKLTGEKPVKKENKKEKEEIEELKEEVVEEVEEETFKIEPDEEVVEEVEEPALVEEVQEEVVDDPFGLSSFNEYGNDFETPEVTETPEDNKEEVEGFVIPDIPENTEDGEIILGEEEAVELESDPVSEEVTAEVEEEVVAPEAEEVSTTNEADLIREELLKYKSENAVNDAMNSKNGIHTSLEDVTAFIGAIKARNLNVSIIPTSTLLAPIENNIAFIGLIDEQKGDVDAIGSVIRRGSYSKEVKRLLVQSQVREVA